VATPAELEAPEALSKAVNSEVPGQVTVERDSPPLGVVSSWTDFGSGETMIIEGGGSRV